MAHSTPLLYYTCIHKVMYNNAKECGEREQTIRVYKHVYPSRFSRCLQYVYELLPYAIVLDHGLICILVIFWLHVFLAPASLSGTK